MSKFQNNPTYLVVEDMDHFWFNSNQLLDSLHNWIRDVLERSPTTNTNTKSDEVINI
jgi:hypothetical protein